MTRLWGKWAVVLVILSLACITGARVLPASELHLQAFNDIFMESCPTPCVMGIQPQITTMTEALAILRNHAWVRQVEPDWDLGLFAQDAIVVWEWSGAQPTTIDSSRPGSLIATAPLGSRLHVVERINVSTTLPMYDLHTAFRQEATGYVRYLPTDDVVIYGLRIGNENAAHSITLSTQLPCPARLIALRNATALISFSGRVSPGHYTPPSALNYLCR